MPAPVRLFHPQGPDRVAVVSSEPAYNQPGRHLIRVARGARAANLSSGDVYGPFDEGELAARFDELVGQLRAAGFVASGSIDLLTALSDSRPQVRARAALRLGWQRHGEAVPQLLKMLSTAVDELCSIIDALGAIGDLRAAEPLRDLAQRKLLSRRRSAVEALRILGDSAGLAEARQRLLGELPEPLAAAVEAHQDAPEPLLEALDGVPSQRLGLYLDALYELATPACVAAVRQRLDDMQFAQPYVWRYVKSIFKRSQLRHDYEMFGWLAHRIEVQGRHGKRISATVKSGYDGVSRKTRIFSRRTCNFVRRSAWRYLRRLATYRPEQYSQAAAAAVAPYSQEDARPPRGLEGQYAHCYLLQRVLFGNSGRLVLNDSRLTFRFRSSQHVAWPAASVREESYPDLWDERPEAYLKLLARARLHLVQEFALRAIQQRHPRLLQEAAIEVLLPILSSPHPPSAELALAELKRRFDPQRPDWDLLRHVAADPLPLLQELARQWLAASAPLWARQPDQALAFLCSPDGATQAAVAQALAAQLRDDPPARCALADRLAPRLRQPETEAVEGLSRVARDVVLQELSQLIGVDEALEWLRSSSPPIQAVAADLLASSDAAAARLGAAQVAALAVHDLGAVRAAAHRMLRSLAPRLQDDPSALFSLVDCNWTDTRQVAVELLRVARDWSRADADQLAGLVDSLRPDVQDFAIDLMRQHADTLDMVELLRRVAQHPHPHVRRFALELAEQRLPAGVEPLRELMPCLRAALLDPWPQRDTKRRALRILKSRGLADAEQGAAAAELLGEVLHTAGKEDFEEALLALTQVQLAHPQLRTALQMAHGAEAGR